MFNRFVARYLFPVAVVVLSLAPGQWAEAGVRGNSYRVTGTLADGAYECFVFTPLGRGPLTFGDGYYSEQDFGLFSTWTSLSVLNLFPQGTVVVAHTGVSVLGLT